MAPNMHPAIQKAIEDSMRDTGIPHMIPAIGWRVKRSIVFRRPRQRKKVTIRPFEFFAVVGDDGVWMPAILEHGRYEVDGESIAGTYPFTAYLVEATLGGVPMFEHPIMQANVFPLSGETNANL